MENDPNSRAEMKLISDLIDKDGKDGINLTKNEKEVLNQLFETHFDVK